MWLVFDNEGNVIDEAHSQAGAIALVFCDKRAAWAEQDGTSDRVGEVPAVEVNESERGDLTA